MKKRFLCMLLVLLMLVQYLPVTVLATGETDPLGYASVEDEVTVASAKSAHPYPSILEFDELESTFEDLAESKILPACREYVLNSIKYHIMSDTNNYRVAKNILRKFSTNDQNAIFVFDGCSINLQGVSDFRTNTASQAGGYRKNGKNI